MQLPGFRMRYVLLGHGATFFIFSCGKERQFSRNEALMDINFYWKRLYGECCNSLDLGSVEPEERKRLPYCVEAKVSQWYWEKNKALYCLQIAWNVCLPVLKSLIRCTHYACSLLHKFYVNKIEQSNTVRIIKLCLLPIYNDSSINARHTSHL